MSEMCETVVRDVWRPPSVGLCHWCVRYMQAEGSDKTVSSLIAFLPINGKIPLVLPWLALHRVTYCEVVDGNVMQPQARTAVHRRKVGNYY